MNDVIDDYLEERMKHVEDYTISSFITLDERAKKQTSVILREIESLRNDMNKLRTEIYELYINSNENEVKKYD